MTLEVAEKQYAARKDALRNRAHSFNDLERLVVLTYDLYRKIHKVVAPYNNRQNGNSIYVPPPRELFTENIRISPNLIESNLFSKMVNSTINYYAKNKGKKQLIEPHPSIHHSFQLNSSQFKLFEVENTKAISKALNKNFNYEVKSLTQLQINGFGEIQPIYFENLRIEKYEYLILRPKMGKTGVPSTKFWEALFFKKSYPYIIEHVDSEMNPRYCGVL